MRRILLFALLTGMVSVFALNPAPSHALDCGEHPGKPPTIPEAAAVTRDTINLAVTAIQAYGQAVNIYLDCLDQNQEDQFFNMTKEQQERWLNDYNTLAEGLADAQEALNRQIRIFNSRQSSIDGDS